MYDNGNPRLFSNDLRANFSMADFDPRQPQMVTPQKEWLDGPLDLKVVNPQE